MWGGGEGGGEQGASCVLNQVYTLPIIFPPLIVFASCTQARAFHSNKKVQPHIILPSMILMK